MNKGYIYSLAVSLLAFMFDRLTKYFSIIKLPEEGVLWLENVGGGIGFVYALNTGVSFSIQLPLFLLSSILIMALVSLMYFLYKAYIQGLGSLHFFSVSLIFFGALGNIIDRIVYGGVVDFIKVFLWPIFNIADIMIVVGVGLWLFYELRDIKRSS